MVAGILNHQPEYFLSVLCVIPIMYGLAWLTVDEVAYNANQINQKKGHTMNQRYETLKREVHDCLVASDRGEVDEKESQKQISSFRNSGFTV